MNGSIVSPPVRSGLDGTVAKSASRFFFAPPSAQELARETAAEHRKARDPLPSHRLGAPTD